MTSTIDPTIGRNGAWAEGVQRASHILEMIVGRAMNAVTATWAVALDERGRPILRLTLADSTGSVATQFTTYELEDGENLWFRLNRLWGDLLQIRSHRLIEGLQKALEGQEGL